VVQVWCCTGTGEGPAGKARRPRIPAVFEGGATQPAGMHRPSNAARLAPRAARITPDDRLRPPDAVPALRDADGHAGSRARRAVETRPVLGLPAVRAALLDHAPGAAAASRRVGRVRINRGRREDEAGKGGFRGAALKRVKCLTSHKEVPTLTPFSSSACDWPRHVNRRGLTGRSSAPPSNYRGPPPPALNPTRSLTEALGMISQGAVHRRTRVCRPGPSLAF
jgi:hypothetical protein